MSMVEKKVVIVTIIGLLTITMTGKTMAQSNFTEYDNKYFSMAYPSGWTVNDTGFGDLSSSYATNHLIVFHSPNDDARIVLEVSGPEIPPDKTLNKSYWLNQFSSANVISIDNQTQYMDGRQALVATTSDQYNKHLMVVTSARVHFPDTQCDKDPNTIVCQPFQFLLMYSTNIDNFPTYLNQFQTMVSKFHVNG